MLGTSKLVGGMIGLGLLAGLSGCINQGQYDRLYEANRSLQAENADLSARLSECQTAQSQMGGAIGRGESTLSELQRQNADLRRQLDQAMSDYKNLDQRIATLSIGPLDSDTARALQGLEDQFPNMISFDEARGMLRVASDLTFDSGSDVVKDSARQALSALSNVLKSGSATQYTIVVEGHTDSQVISNPATKQNHKTNRHLSAHRAIGVINTLAGMGVDSSRMMAAGWGEHRPAVPNNANGNTAANRRVELYLARTNGTTAQAPAGVQKATPNTPALRQPAYDVTK